MEMPPQTELSVLLIILDRLHFLTWEIHTQGTEQIVQLRLQSLTSAVGTPMVTVTFDREGSAKNVACSLARV